MNRLLGLIPLSFFLLKVVEYSQDQTLFDLLWLCNLANVFLALAIFIYSAGLIWLATLLILSGIIPWLLSATCDPLTFTSFLTHIASSAIGIYLCLHLAHRQSLWWWGVLIFIAVQFLSRALTPSAANVNVVFFIYENVKPWFSNFTFYLIVNNLGFAISLFLYELFLNRLLKTKTV